MEVTSTGGGPVHPGIALRREIRRLGVSTKAVAKMLCVSRQALYDVFSAKQRVTASFALRAARLTGTSARTWLNMQLEYDLMLARRSLGSQLAEVPQLEENW